MMSYSLAGNNVKYGAEQAGNPDGSGTISQRIGNPSRDTGTPAQVCSKQVTRMEYENTGGQQPGLACCSTSALASSRTGQLEPCHANRS